MARRFPGGELARRQKQVAKQQIRYEVRERMSPGQQESYARQLLRNELRETLSLPTVEAWCEEREQMMLF
jgi:hypothetical protein